MNNREETELPLDGAVSTLTFLLKNVSKALNFNMEFSVSVTQVAAINCLINLLSKTPIT